jgi:hypothetical protein
MQKTTWISLLLWNIYNPNPHFSKAHQINLNLNNFKMIEGKGLKLLNGDPLELHYLRTKFHENVRSSSEAISRGHKDRQTGDLISLLSFLNVG